MAFAKEIVQVIKQAHGVGVSISTAIGGTLGAIAWTSMYESLAQMEVSGAKLMADPSYVAMLRKVEGLVVPGSGHDQLWRVV
jgi:hypothetical protein